MMALWASWNLPEGPIWSLDYFLPRSALPGLKSPTVLKLQIVLVPQFSFVFKKMIMSGDYYCFGQITYHYCCNI